jgi:excisionase family DNA binding protein
VTERRAGDDTTMDSDKADQVQTYDWITPAQAAARLGTAVRDVYRLVDRGRLPAYRIGGEIRLRDHEVDDYAHEASRG